MRKAKITAAAEITIPESEFFKVEQWDEQKLASIVTELTAFSFNVKTNGGIKLTLEVVSPSPLEIYNAVKKAKNGKMK